MVHPCIIGGQQTLIYERGLKYKHPVAYITLLHYAKINGYQIKEDRRSDFIEGVKRVKDPTRANLISIMVLTASMLSQNLAADDIDVNFPEGINANIGQIQTYPHIDLAMSSFSNHQQLMDGMLGWINEHTSFEFKVDHLPKLDFVDKLEIAQIAFGRDLPSNIDASTLHILGLYNMHEKTVYLLDSVDLETEAGRGVLLHELVHYLQYEEALDKEVECKNELEALAYMLEAKYLSENDLEADFSQQHINKVSECRT